MFQILDTRMGFPSPSLNVVIDYFFHSCLKMCKICQKRTIDATFLDCLALTFCDVIGELLPEWACLTLQGGTTFLLTSNLGDNPVSRVRKTESYAKEKYQGMFEIQKSGDKTSSGEIGIDIRTHTSPKVAQDQVSGGESVFCWYAAPVAYVLWEP